MSAHHDPDAEMAVLGCVLLGPSVLPRLREQGLKPKHFHRKAHGAIFEAMLTVADAGHEPDVLLVCEQLEREQHDFGPNREWLRSHVHMLTLAVPSLGNWKAYAQQVIDCAHLRAVAIYAERIRAAVYDSDRDTLNESYERLTEIGLPDSWRDDKAEVTPLRRSRVG